MKCMLHVLILCHVMVVKHLDKLTQSVQLNTVIGTSTVAR